MDPENPGAEDPLSLEAALEEAFASGWGADEGGEGEEDLQLDAGQDQQADEDLQLGLEAPAGEDYDAQAGTQGEYGTQEAETVTGAGGGGGYEDEEGGDMGDEALADEGGGEAGGEAEGDDMDDGALGEGLTDKDQEEAGRMARIIATMTDEQLDRYEAFRRSSLARPKMKKFVSSLLSAQVNDKAVIALCGIGKMFVGDLVEMARHLAAMEGHTGPLLPRHVRTAYQQLDAAHRVPHSRARAGRLFR